MSFFNPDYIFGLRSGPRFGSIVYQGAGDYNVAGAMVECDCVPPGSASKLSCPQSLPDQDVPIDIYGFQGIDPATGSPVLLSSLSPRPDYLSLHYDVSVGGEAWALCHVDPCQCVVVDPFQITYQGISHAGGHPVIDGPGLDGEHAAGWLYRDTTIYTDAPDNTASQVLFPYAELASVDWLIEGEFHSLTTNAAQSWLVRTYYIPHSAPPGQWMTVT